MTWFTIVKNTKKDAVKDAEAFWKDYKRWIIERLTHMSNILGTSTGEDYTEEDRKMGERASTRINSWLMGYVSAFEELDKKPIKERLISIRDNPSPFSIFLAKHKIQDVDFEELNRHIEALE